MLRIGLFLGRRIGQGGGAMTLWLKMILCVIGVELLGGAMALTMGDSLSTWYADLEKPPGTPPNSVFGPVWSVLFALMGIALALVWHRGRPPEAKTNALVWFGIQFALNLAWTPFFFGLRQMGIALGIILALIVAVAVTIAKFRKVDPIAPWLLVPYLLWVCYATYLNAGNWWLNR